MYFSVRSSRSNCTIRLDARPSCLVKRRPTQRAELMAADLMETLAWEGCEADAIGLLVPLFGTDLEETLAQGGILCGLLGKRQAFDRQILYGSPASQIASHFTSARLLHFSCKGWRNSRVC